MREDERLERNVPSGPPTEHVGHPRGTLAIMLFFLMTIVGMWAYVYLLMIERS